jgi:hypothetical protein
VASSDGHSREPLENKGFSGLKSLLSDVSLVVDQTPGEMSAAATTTASDEPPPGSMSPISTESNETVNTGAADQSPGGTPAGEPSTKGGSYSGGGQQGTARASASAPLWLAAVAVSSAVLFFMFGSGQQDSRSSAQLNAPDQMTEVAREQVKTPRIYAVAAMNANLRALPSTRSKVTGTLERGRPVVAIEQRDGFIKMRGPCNSDSCISSDLLIEMTDLARLQAYTPADYIAARDRFNPIDRLTEHLDHLSPRILLLLTQVEEQKNGLATTIKEIEGYDRPEGDIDSAAGLWFSLAARASADAGDHVEAIRLATAAIYANPLKVDYHTALGFSAITLGRRDLLEVTAAILPALAPGATNTWIVVGINAALSGRTELAHGALLMSLSRSRNRATTVRALRGMAARSNDAGVVAAVDRALALPKGSTGDTDAIRAN